MSKSEKIPLSIVKKMPYKTLMRLINKAKKYLKSDGVMQQIFNDYNLDIEEIDYIPTFFKKLDVSAKTDHGVVYLNYKLLTDGDFFKDYSYLIHEYTHWCQQTTGDKPTKSSDDGEYLDNKYEIEGFTNQVEYIAGEFGDDEAEDYVDDLLEHHEIDGEKYDDKKEELMAKV